MVVLEESSGLLTPRIDPSEIMRPTGRLMAVAFLGKQIQRPALAAESNVLGAK